MIKLDDITIYDIKECAEILHVSPQTVRAYTRQGKVRSQKVGGRIYIPAEDLKKLIQKGTEE